MGFGEQKKGFRLSLLVRTDESRKWNVVFGPEVTIYCFGDIAAIHLIRSERMLSSVPGTIRRKEEQICIFRFVKEGCRFFCFILWNWFSFLARFSYFSICFIKSRGNWMEKIRKPGSGRFICFRMMLWKCCWVRRKKSVSGKGSSCWWKDGKLKLCILSKRGLHGYICWVTGKIWRCGFTGLYEMLAGASGAVPVKGCRQPKKLPFEGIFNPVFAYFWESR